MLYTNLIPHHGFLSLPVILPDQTPPAGSTRVVLDIEGDVEKGICRGERESIYKAIDAICDFRSRIGTPIHVGMYWWPPVTKRADLSHAKHFWWLLSGCDFACPSVYSLTASDMANVRRANWWAKGVKVAGSDSMPRIAFLCPKNIFDGTDCTKAQIRHQLKAARLLGCEDLCVWSGVGYQVTLAKLGEHASDADKVRRSEAWTRLVNDYGFALGGSFSHADIDREYRLYSERTLGRFKECIR